MSLDTNLLSNHIRKTILKMINSSGAGHIGSAFSLVEILDSIFSIVDIEKIKNKQNNRDRIIFSKGHAASGLYAVMFHYGLLTESDISSYFKDDTLLAGHASHHTPYVEHSTGGLGHGLPVGVGIAIGLKRLKINSRVFVVLGDGEMHEGSNWEAIMYAGHHKLSNLILFIDVNNLSQVGIVDDCCTLEPITNKFESFNFNIHEVNGHDKQEILKVLEISKNSSKPTAIICRTVKGKGISYMENNNLWHYKCPKDDDYEKAVKELEEN